MKLPFLRHLAGNGRKIVVNVLWATMGKVVNMLGALFVGILVARYLGPEQYGLMNYVISYVMIFTVVSSFGLDNIEIRELAKAPDERDQIMGTCFRLRWAFSLLAFLMVVASLLIHRADAFTTAMILAYSSTLFLQNFNVIRNYFYSIVKNKSVVQTEMTRTVLGACIKIALLLMKAPLAWFILATAFDALLVASGYYLSYRRHVGSLRSWTYSRSRARFIVGEAFPLMLSGAAIIVYQRIDQVMIGNMIDNESVGYFATAGKFLDLILFVPMVLTQTIIPLLIGARDSTQPEEFHRKKLQFMSTIVWVSILIALLFSLTAYWLIFFTYGRAYLPAVAVLQIMAWKTVGMALSSTSGQIIIMENLQKWAAIRNLVGCLVCIVLNLLLIPRYGIIGSAWVTIFTVMMSGFISNAIIPPYRPVFRLQCQSLLTGWRDLFKLKAMLTKQ